MLSLSNPASIDFFIRGETRRSMSQHARSRQANFLGLWVSPMVYGPFEGLYARNEYRFDPSDLAEMIKNPQVIEAMRRNFTEAEAQKDLMPMTQALLCCRYHPVTFNQLDLDGQDRAESEWGHYLISLAERGFRAREFHVEGSYQVLNTVFKAPFPASMGSCFYSPIIFPNHAYRASLFAAVEVSPAFEDEYLCTFASHLAARSNCPEILKLLKAMGANFMLQDHLKYSTGLSGLTAFHHAAHGLADRALAHLLYEEKPDLKALLDTEGNTILHALACSVSTTAAGKAQQLAVFDIIETALRMPVFARHALLEERIFIR
ncbi:MAG: hypothetical protein NTV32_05520 [Gammaproteobacteria bacterium]|nr:hypothetical protein [Gammaproteobacteria bacterium]